MKQIRKNSQSGKAEDERMAPVSSRLPCAFGLSPSEQDDPRVIEALREYVTALEAE